MSGEKATAMDSNKRSNKETMCKSSVAKDAASISPSSVRSPATDQEVYRFNSMLIRKQSSSPEFDELTIRAASPTILPPTLPPLPPRQSPNHRTKNKQLSQSQAIASSVPHPEGCPRKHACGIANSRSLSPTPSFRRSSSTGEDDLTLTKPSRRNVRIPRPSSGLQPTSFEKTKKSWYKHDPPPPLRPPARRRSRSSDRRQAASDKKNSPKSDLSLVYRAADTVREEEPHPEITRWSSLDPSLLSSTGDERTLTSRVYFSSSYVESQKPELAKAIMQKPCLKSSFRRSASDEYKRHGVIQYMRPDGFDLVNSRKYSATEAKASSNEALQKTRARNLEGFNKLLESIDKSNLEDRANRAGRVLKSMKENLIEPDDRTRRLLAECSRARIPPPQQETNKVNLQVGIMEANVIDCEEEINKSVEVIKKKVRFSPTTSTRIIRRRRSISSMERWDDPLTPPKRVMTPPNLIAGRFAAGLLTDDTPAIPRRSGSVCSGMTVSSSESLESEYRPNTSSTESQLQIFKLPFATASPITVTRKVPIGLTRDRQVPTKVKREISTQMDDMLLTPTERGGGSAPIAPVRKRGENSPSNSPEQAKDGSKLNIALPKATHKVTPNTTDYRSEQLCTPPPFRPALTRRFSIGSELERRMSAPLTPPRRISEPLAIFIAQNSLKNSSRNDTPTPSKKMHVMTAIQIATPKSERKTKCPPSSEKSTRELTRFRSPSKSFCSADDDESIFSHLSNVARHESSMAETWTKIRLPRRSFSSVSMPGPSSEHTMKSTQSAMQRKRTESPLRVASAHSEHSVASVDLPKPPTSPWKRVTPIKPASERFSPIPRLRKNLGPHSATATTQVRPLSFSQKKKDESSFGFC